MAKRTSYYAVARRRTEVWEATEPPKLSKVCSEPKLMDVRTWDIDREATVAKRKKVRFVSWDIEIPECARLVWSGTTMTLYRLLNPVRASAFADQMLFSFLV